MAFYGVVCLGGIGILLWCKLACMGRVVGSVAFVPCASVWGMLYGSLGTLGLA